tara:strand:- start:1569 stop:1937 length:369 start_codon:yes stop_codon:yes gene_type:complete
MEMFFPGKRIQCEKGCPLCHLEDKGSITDFHRETDLMMWCENGCCSFKIPMPEIEEAFGKMDNALRWETTVNLSELCKLNARNLMVVPMMIEHNPQRWTNSVTIDMDESEQDRIWDEFENRQ